MEYIAVGLAAFVVSIGSAIAGGGGGLVITPLMLLLGFPPQTVLASSKAAGLGINLGAITKFIKHKDVIRWRWAGLFSAVAVVAAVLGTQLVFVLEAEALKTLVGLVTVGLVPVIYFNRAAGNRRRQPSRWQRIIGVGLYLVIMSAQAGLGSGIGMLLMFVLMGPLGFDALGANATKRVAGLVLVVVSFTIFAFSGYMNWLLALVLAVSTLAGGYLGAHCAVKYGNRLVKRALLAAAFIIGWSVLVS